MLDDGVGLAQASDHAIWKFAIAGSWIVVSKDEDFVHLANTSEPRWPGRRRSKGRGSAERTSPVESGLRGPGSRSSCSLLDLPEAIKAALLGAEEENAGWSVRRALREVG